MKEHFENLSNFSFDDVRMHYNSDKPAQLNALAYTQGNKMFVEPGEKKYLGYLAQQKQDQVESTMRMQWVSVNCDVSFEKEANMMGKEDVQKMKFNSRSQFNSLFQTHPVVQRIGQDKIESYYYRKLGIQDKMESFGGLCGGWTSIFIKDPSTAVKMWNKMKEDVITGKSKPTHDNKNFFRRVMFYHYCMREADTNTNEEVSEEELTRDILRNPRNDAIQKEITKSESYIGGKNKEPSYMCDNKEDLVSFILEKITDSTKTKFYLASPGHHMAIVKLGTSKFILSETMYFGMGEVNEQNLKKCLLRINWYSDEEEKQICYFNGM
jgi:hypothetical protein